MNIHLKSLTKPSYLCDTLGFCLYHQTNESCQITPSYLVGQYSEIDKQIRLGILSFPQGTIKSGTGSEEAVSLPLSANIVPNPSNRLGIYCTTRGIYCACACLGIYCILHVKGMASTTTD